MEAIEKVKLKNGNELRIYPDPDPQNPRDMDNLGIFALFHRRYGLPNESGISKESIGSWEDLGEKIQKRKPIAVFPVYMYDHSGISLSLSSTYPYDDKWDAGQVGFIYTTQERMSYIGTITDESIFATLAVEVDEYNRYLRGEAYGYEVVKSTTCDKCKHTKEEVVDSCWGFDTPDSIKNEFENEIVELLGDSDESAWNQEQKQEA